MRSALLLAAALLVGGVPSARADDGVPGRFASISLGATFHGRYGEATAQPPDLLRNLPELQLAWGMQLADCILVFTRFDILGGMLPLLPSGAGIDLGAAWAPGLGEEGWRPQVRFAMGAFYFGAGGETATGDDYSATGFRMALEIGLFDGARMPSGALFRWGVVAGGQATALVHVEPCGPDDDCSEAMLGPSVRAEAQILF